MHPQPRLRDLDAIVLAGGDSKRMGLHKALLPLGTTTLIGSVLAVLQPVFQRVFVVAHSTEGLAELGVEVLTDDRPQRGPLVGIVRGLAATASPWAFVVGCDMPFLRPEVIHRMAQNLSECDILATYLDGRIQPLHAFYSGGCLPAAQRLLDEDTTSVQALFSRCRTRTMSETDFLDLDPELRSFRDIDTPEDYRAAQELGQRFQTGDMPS